MKLQLTTEHLAKIKATPDDALLAEWVITMRMLKRPADDAVDLLHARLDTGAPVVAADGTTITRKIQGGSYEVLDRPKFFAEARTLLGTDERLAAVMKPSMTALKDQIAEVLNVPKSGKASVTAETVFRDKFGALVEQGEKRILVFF